MSEPIRQSGQGWSIELTPSPEQTPEDIEREFERSKDFARKNMEGGTTELRSYFHRFGPVKFMWRKQVGPPKWRLPHPRIDLTLHRPIHLHLGIGWHFTAHSLHFQWAGSKR